MNIFPINDGFRRFEQALHNNEMLRVRGNFFL